MSDLTPHARNALISLSREPQPRQEYNPGLSKSLLELLLVESAMLPSPYKSHRGRSIEYLRITDAGRAAVQLKTL